MSRIVLQREKQQKIMTFRGEHFAISRQDEEIWKIVPKLFFPKKREEEETVVIWRKKEQEALGKQTINF